MHDSDPYNNKPKSHLNHDIRDREFTTPEVSPPSNSKSSSPDGVQSSLSHKQSNTPSHTDSSKSESIQTNDDGSHQANLQEHSQSPENQSESLPSRMKIRKDSKAIREGHSTSERPVSTPQLEPHTFDSTSPEDAVHPAPSHDHVPPFPAHPSKLSLAFASPEEQETGMVDL